ncbi:MAG: Molybdate-binding domain of ModE [uncultured Solirubrobacteraceae bacterium]|uniref:Molybdate-binding domain of ModE n=1 Tax=uncultured Solirubrobacteraceae bacterium TaxID=1162706 RepID=A0A6J4R2W4_9ACTN|nr:MAG: Molybdate-binding domain of ModE [uncultured Solirubrobacteraceae bacterium]
MKLSARNQLSAKVVRVEEGAVTTLVELDVQGQRLVSSITAEAARELGLAEGQEVTAIVKASDVMIGV